MGNPTRVPAQAWIVTFAGTAINLCLGILYAWSVWKTNLVDREKAGLPMTGQNEGWLYLTDAEATWAYSICGFVFALCMIPGGRIQDKYGPKFGATLGGLCLAAGCILAGLMQSFTGLVLGFGVLGGIGMGLGYAASTPAAVKWFGPHQRGLIVGLVVAGYGGAAIYISPLAEFLLLNYGLSGSFIGLGILFALVVIIAGQLLALPPAGYVPPAPPVTSDAKMKTITGADWSAGNMLRTWQFYALVFLFICSAQSGLLAISNAKFMLVETARIGGRDSFFAANAWLLVSFGGFINAAGRIGTGSYSDRIGRANAYLVNGLISALCLFLMPTIMSTGNALLLFAAVGVMYWQYGGGLALMPAFTADFFGSKNLGFNYGLVFLGWGIAFFVPQLASYMRLEYGFYLSGGLLLSAVVLSRCLRRPGSA